MAARILAFDTSTAMVHIGVCAHGRRLTRSEAGGAPASARLVPAAMQMLADVGTSIREVDAIAFGRGPGAFTGLRIACAVAQGFAFGAGKPVLAIDSLLIAAEDAMSCAEECDDDIWVAMDARMDEVYLARYRRLAHGSAGGSRWHTVLEPALYTLPALERLWTREPPHAIAGSALAEFGARLPAGDARCHAQPHDPAAALLRLAERAFEDGAGMDAAQALPVYVRDKVALTTAERLAQRAARSGGLR